MHRELMVDSNEAVRLARELSALTGEDIASAVTRALGAELARAREERRGEAAAALARAMRRSLGAGIPANHCWGP
jgi:hypothetical protein